MDKFAREIIKLGQKKSKMHATSKMAVILLKKSECYTLNSSLKKRCITREGVPKVKKEKSK